MAVLINCLFLAALIVFVAVVHLENSRNGWPDDRPRQARVVEAFTSEAFRFVLLALALLSAVGLVTSAIGNGISADMSALASWLLNAAAGLLAFAVVALVFSLLIPKP